MLDVRVPPLFELAVVLALLVAGTAAANRRRLYLPLALVAFAGVVGVNSFIAWREVDAIRKKFPFESLADRLPERPVVPSEPEPEDTDIARLEAEIRVRHLQSLHERAVEWFATRPNFGVARMVPKDEYGLKGRPGTEPVLQPPDWLISGGAVAVEEQSIPFAPVFARMHADGVRDFANPWDFGYVRSREQVAGFVPHRMTKTPAPTPEYRLRSVDLIGLVVHPEPVRYVSNLLPRMDDLRDAPTRPPTAFEAAGLAELRAGKELYAREASDKSVRLLGAIRNAAQCQKCHGGHRGDLLGAFSYELRAVE